MQPRGRRHELESLEFVATVKEWRSRIEDFQLEMGAKASRLEKAHYWIGAPSVVMSTAAATTMFSEQGGDTGNLVKLSVALVSLVAATLAGLMTFYSHARRAEMHRSIAAQLTGLRRALEIHMRFPPQTREEMVATLEKLNKAISEVTDKAPTIRFDRSPRNDETSHMSSGGGAIMPSSR